MAKTTKAKMTAYPLPRFWRQNPYGGVACPHRDGTVCMACDTEYPEVVPFGGVYRWIPMNEQTVRDHTARRLARGERRQAGADLALRMLAERAGR